MFQRVQCASSGVLQEYSRSFEECFNLTKCSARFEGHARVGSAVGGVCQSAFSLNSRALGEAWGSASVPTRRAGAPEVWEHWESVERPRRVVCYVALLVWAEALAPARA